MIRFAMTPEILAAMGALGIAHKSERVPLGDGSAHFNIMSGKDWARVQSHITQ